MMTSGGNRNPANADSGGRTGRRRFECFTVQACLTRASINATDPRGGLWTGIGSAHRWLWTRWRWASRVDQAVPVCQRDQLRAVAGAEFGHGVADVGFRGG